MWYQAEAEDDRSRAAGRKPASDAEFRGEGVPWTPPAPSPPHNYLSPVAMPPKQAAQETPGTEYWLP